MKQKYAIVPNFYDINVLLKERKLLTRGYNKQYEVDTRMVSSLRVCKIVKMLSIHFHLIATHLIFNFGYVHNYSV